MVALGKKSIGGLSFRKKSSTPTQEVLGRQKQKKSTTSTQHKHQHTDKTPRHSNTKFVLTNKRHDYSDDESSVSHSSSSSSDDYDESYDDESRFTYDDSVVVGRNGIHDMSVKDEHDDELNRCGTSWDDDEQQDNAFFDKSVKVETQQAVVKVVEHGNIEKLVLEVSAVCVLCVCVCSCHRVVIVHYSFMCTLRICAITLDLYCLTKQHFVAANFHGLFFFSSSLERILYIGEFLRSQMLRTR